ncbi:MAG: aminotransferase class I/II-fold pyridoxal phosphate-dependent enzyme [Chloroflexi bacterium]|nr:aminotransferase class I/II-fold pyridoxal phosphate-dependent enzyme [Chloroflexota bacterium]
MSRLAYPTHHSSLITRGRKAVLRVSGKTLRFTESVIREMTRLYMHYAAGHGVNLAQGMPDFPAPQEVKDAACAAIQADLNQYAITWGSKRLRDAIAAKTRRFAGLEIDPEREITVACGSTEAMLSTLLALVDPGDEVIVMSPFYENYWPDAVLAGAVPRFVTMHEPDWHLDPDELRAAFNNRTRAIVVNTPNNPTGKVFNRAELQLIADLCQQWNVVAVTDEIYEHMVYEGEHIPLATLPGMRERTVTISGVSKTYSITGWRIGYAIACPELTAAIRKVHDFATVGAPAPLQEGAAVALSLPDSYYTQLCAEYRARRDLIVAGLDRLGFRCFKPAGAYYVMADHTAFGYDDDVAFAQYLVREVGVAVVPGSSFYIDPAQGRNKIRFCFPKRTETLRRALDLLGTVHVRDMAPAQRHA